MLNWFKKANLANRRYAKVKNLKALQMQCFFSGLF